MAAIIGFVLLIIGFFIGIAGTESNLVQSFVPILTFFFGASGAALILIWYEIYLDERNNNKKK